MASVNRPEQRRRHAAMNVAMAASILALVSPPVTRAILWVLSVGPSSAP